MSIKYAAYDNTVVVGTQDLVRERLILHLLVHRNTARAISEWFENLPSPDTYRVPSLSGRYLIWAGWKFWNEWQAPGAGCRRQPHVLQPLSRSPCWPVRNLLRGGRAVRVFSSPPNHFVRD